MSLNHAFKLIHQNLVISRISFEKRLLLGLSELHIIPLVPDVTLLRINCKQCRLFDVIVNDVCTADYAYCDPTQQVCPPDSVCSLDNFQNSQNDALDSVDSEKRLGEVTVYLPKQCHNDINEGKLLKISIEFALVEPACGLHFVLPKLEDGTLLKNAMHLFTCNDENSCRSWFPCIDSHSELCTWKIEVLVDAMLTVICSGELTETLTTPDGTKKTFIYELTIPTAAPNIGLVIGPFEQLTDTNMNEVKHYCLPHLMPLLKHTTSILFEAFEFYEELLSVRYPYQSYKQVFVDEAYEDTQSFSSLTIFSTNLLHSARIIDQTPISRMMQATGLAHQFFGCFITRHSWYDAWLTAGITKYLVHQYQKVTFGNNEYRYLISQEMDELCAYEQNTAPIVLDPSTGVSMPYFNVQRPQTVPLHYINIFTKKAHLVLRMLENRLGKELLLQVFNKILSLATLSATSEFNSGMWDNILLSTKLFLKSIFAVTGKDMQAFVDQWVCQSGCARFTGTFVFNRKRNVVELELKQEMASKGALKYVGPLTVTIQELDGSFNHPFKIEENKYKFEITCHSKSRRHKKKKIPLMTGEEIDMDLSAMDADSPVLWLRVDPDMQILRAVSWEQPDFMWQYQLRHERDVVAQLEAIEALAKYPTPNTRQALMDVIDDDHCFYRVRLQATHCLAKVANHMAASWAGPPAMMNIFKKMFGSHSCPNIVRQHWFKNLQHYHLQKTIPVTMASVRSSQGICPAEVLKFILDLFKYSDNSRNKFSDCYYTAALVDAVTLTITNATALISVNPGQQTLSAETKLILEEITRLLNLEKLLPSYRNVITVSCLRCIRVLQQNGHLPSSAHLFKNYAQYGIFLDVRLAALSIIAGFLQEGGATQKVQLDYLLELAETDPLPRVRFHILHELGQSISAIVSPSSELNTPQLAQCLWWLMNKYVSCDTKLCCEVVELYYKLYGRKKPACLSPLQVAKPAAVGLHSGSSQRSLEENILVQEPMDLIIAEDATTTAIEGELTKSRLKKKKKKNKHKHKHKTEKRDRDEAELTERREVQRVAEVMPSVVTETLLTLSEPSSPEPDD